MKDNNQTPKKKLPSIRSKPEYRPISTGYAPSEMDKMAGQLLRELRLLRSKSQADIADACGCKFQQIQKYETGANRMSVSRLILVCDALCITPAQFMKRLTDLLTDFENKGFEYPELAARDVKLISDFRSLPEATQQSIRSLMKDIGVNSET